MLSIAKVSRVAIVVSTEGGGEYREVAHDTPEKKDHDHHGDPVTISVRITWPRTKRSASMADCKSR